MTDAITVRPIDFARDIAPLMSFLDGRDRMRLEHCEAGVQAGDCFIFVADEDGTAVGWAVVHTKFRDDQDWSPPDEDTKAFQQGDNAYLENIEVTARQRSNGVGRHAARGGADRGEAPRARSMLWLHTSENNVKAHRSSIVKAGRVERTVYPPWKPTSRTRVYRKVL